jgi:5-methylcytosine-specific restriction endonuclease McrA
VHHVYGQVHARSYAALLALNARYAAQEFTDLAESLQMPEATERWQLRLWFNTRFLRAQEVNGPLTCAYCGKTNLVINSPRKSTLATADHVLPISRGGGAFDLANVVVACATCNTDKDDRTPEEWQEKSGK